MRFLILGLALAGAVFLAIVLLDPFAGSNGSEDVLEAGIPGGNLCDRPLPALGSGQITQEQFDVADAGLDQTVRLADEADVHGAQLAFLTEVHDFTHDVDAPLRDANEGLARSLCKAVVQIEAEFAFGGEAATIAEEAEGIRDLMRRAAAELGYAPSNR